VAQTSFRHTPARLGTPRYHRNRLPPRHTGHSRVVVVVARRRRIDRGRTIDDEANSCGVSQIQPLFRRVGHIGLIPENNVLSVHIFAVPIRELTPDARAPTDVFDYRIASSEDEVVVILWLRDNGSFHVPAIVIEKDTHAESGNRIAYQPAMIGGISSRYIEFSCLGLQTASVYVQI
jgi:hypothetical protein